MYQGVEMVDVVVWVSVMNFMLSMLMLILFFLCCCGQPVVDDEYLEWSGFHKQGVD